MSIARRLLGVAGLLLVTGLMLYGLQVPLTGGVSGGTILDPMDGLYRTARTAAPPADSSVLRLDGLEHPVRVVRDRRHVPHIFAESDRDAIIALGYVAARDRLFQLDFIPRVASGRLAEAFGRQAVQADRFLRSTGMEWGAQKNLTRIRRADGIELAALEWYGRGVNAYLDRLSPGALPLEFRLLGYRPDRYTPIQGLRLLQYMSFDLTYHSDEPAYASLRAALDSTVYNTLYPETPPGLFAPIIPPAQQIPGAGDAGGRPASAGRSSRVPDLNPSEMPPLARRLGGRDVAGKGSNNWAVHEGRSATGAPLLAGDMHLSLNLPSVWYEAHIVTPTMNAHGLTIPGAPVLVQAFNRHVGWTLTNAATDLIDHYELRLDSSGTRYRFEGAWRPLRRTVDTIRVNRGAPVLDTTYYSHHGPVDRTAGGPRTAIATRWVAHDSSRTLRALWRMNRATHTAEVRAALRDWDTPMQNVLYAGTDGTIAVRTSGYLPVRRSGDGRGLLDGTTDAAAWVGRVPFDSLPAARNPEQAYLASANQRPTGAQYPYYLGHDWGDGYRSLRINALLEGQAAHGVDDFRRYQADVQVPHHRVFAPMLAGLDGLSPRADTIRRRIRKWDGAATVDAAGPLVFDVFLRELRRATWDEPVFATAPDPGDAPLVHLLRTDPDARWFDRPSTPQTEDASALLAHALEATADTMSARYGEPPAAGRWGDHHRLVLRHLSGTEALRPLGRGPYEYPGFENTLSPAAGHTVSHSASQRVIVDFSTRPPRGYGVYPGGQSGRPLDPRFYDTQVPAYLNFEYFPLRLPASPAALPSERTRSTRVLRPR